MNKANFIRALCTVVVIALSNLVVTYAPKWLCFFLMALGWDFMWKFCRDYIRLADKYNDFG